MIYILYTFLAGVLSGLISIAFRMMELKKETILFGKQMILQIAMFVGFALVFQRFFSSYTLENSLFTLNWFWIFFIISSLSYYMVQVIFEWKTGTELFPTPEEMDKLIDERMNQKDENKKK